MPPPVREVYSCLLHQAGKPTYLVGGPVRDLLLGRPVRDWDLATAARPDEVKAIFPLTVDTGLAHGTVTVVHLGQYVEVTTFRTEGPYLDGRRPSAVSFGATLDDDLARRDFTINAMALGPSGPDGPEGFLRDPWGGVEDLVGCRVRAVGDPYERFADDHLRIIRAYRIAAELGFRLDPLTEAAAAEGAPALSKVAAERIREEFSRILLAPRVARGLEKLRSAGIAGVILPELVEGYGFEQNEYHPYDVWHHSVLACEHIQPQLHLRLAALLHDVAKPATLSVDEEGRRHFYDHERIGAGMAAAILRRLRYGNEVVGRVAHLISRHMDLHDLPPGAGDAAVRRMASRVGREHIGDLLRLRRADRLASGKEGPVSRGTLDVLARLAALDHAEAALKVRDLKIDGRGVMEVTGLGPGPEIGRILDALLEAVLDDPALNNPADLERLARRLALPGDGREGNTKDRTRLAEDA